MTAIASETLVELGRTGIKVPALGIGAWAWGERLFWGFGRGYGKEDVRGAFTTAMQAGVNFFDTAEAYGRGKSEQFLGEFIRESGQPVIVATKFMPYPWRLWKSRLLAALRGSLQRLGLERVDLYQIHWHLPPIPVETWVEGLADAVEQDLARAVGVSNYSAGQMRRAFDTLAAHNIPLASNQVEYSLINRKVEENGLLELCKELDVTLIAYSPLGQGLLTGKYTPENPPSGIRGLRYRVDLLRRTGPLVRLMEDIGQEHGGKTPAQVALNWTICKGALPIPGAKNARQARENMEALGWRLTPSQVASLDQASRELGK